MPLFAMLIPKVNSPTGTCTSDCSLAPYGILCVRINVNFELARPTPKVRKT
jgi:hypothetical protein